MTKAIALAKANLANDKDKRTRYLFHECGGYSIDFKAPTDRHYFEVTADGVRFRNAERATLAG